MDKAEWKANTEPDRETVADAIRRAFPHDAERVLRDMRWSSLDECWLVRFCGMTVGIEPDGYIHS